MSIFDFFLMMDNYEARKIGKFDATWGFISTCYVNDADKDYETAVKHRDYNEGKIVIVETYDTHHEATLGHERWVTTMTSDKLPDKLVDSGSAGVAKMLDLCVGDNEWRIKEREEPRQ
jgi:hypothetical protein